MSTDLPEFIEPIALATKQARLLGRLPLAGMDRLADLLSDTAGWVEVDLAFAVADRRPVISGRVAASPALRCQSCLESFALTVESPLSLGVVASVDEALRLPDTMEAVILAPGDELRLLDLVQDEILLALPAIPRHPVCQAPVTAEPVKVAPPRRHPFADLAQLKS